MGLQDRGLRPFTVTAYSGRARDLALRGAVSATCYVKPTLTTANRRQLDELHRRLKARGLPRTYGP